MRKGFLALFLLFLAPPIVGQTDYFPGGADQAFRPNGMDLNRDGTIAEAGVDDLACDEQDETETSNISTENLDGAVDAALERQIYVDRSTGTDNSTCGTPGSPCATINYAVTTRGQATTGSGDNMFICVAGTTSSQPDIDDTDFDGGSGTYTLSASRSNSNQRWDHQLPQNPTVIMGWDTDNDNQYPPFDTDDTAVWTTSGSSHLQCSITTCPSRIEFAHMSSDNAGQTSSTGGGFIQFGSGTVSAGRMDHWYIHDMSVTDVNGFQCQHSGNVAFSFQGQADDLIVMNNYFSVGGGYIWRGGKTGTSNVYAQNFFHIYAIGGTSTALDNNGTDCTSAGGGDPTGVYFMRTWHNGSSVDAEFEYIDNSFVVDRSVGTDGYRDGLTGSSDIRAGIILAGWRHWNFSGNYLQDIFEAAPSAHFNDGININQSSQDHYRENNTHRLTHTGAVNTGTISPLFANLSQGLGTGGGTRDEMEGDYFVQDNCQDTSGQSSYGYNSWIMLEGSAGHVFTGADYRVTGNSVQASFNFGRSLHNVDPNSSCGTDCVPSSHLFADNLFRSVDGASTTDPMWNGSESSWAGVWSASSGNNDYYSDNFRDGNTLYSTLAAWQAVVTETGSTAATNPTFPGCFALTDGTDYTSGASPPPASPTSYFRIFTSD